MNLTPAFFQEKLVTACYGCKCLLVQSILWIEFPCTWPEKKDRSNKHMNISKFYLGNVSYLVSAVLVSYLYGARRSVWGSNTRTGQNLGRSRESKRALQFPDRKPPNTLTVDLFTTVTFKTELEGCRRTEMGGLTFHLPLAHLWTRREITVTNRGGGIALCLLVDGNPRGATVASYLVDFGWVRV